MAVHSAVPNSSSLRAQFLLLLRVSVSAAWRTTVGVGGTWWEYKSVCVDMIVVGVGVVWELV